LSGRRFRGLSRPSLPSRRYAVGCSSGRHRQRRLRPTSASCATSRSRFRLRWVVQLMLNESLAAAQQALTRVLSDPEELAALDFPPPLGRFILGPGLLSQHGSRLTADFVLWDSADSPGRGMPYRTRVRLVHGHTPGSDYWHVQYIESMCPSCFGTGFLEGDRRLCDTCGAVGWGVREVLATTAAADPLDSPSPAPVAGGA
jgi:hypothetical protein